MVTIELVSIEILRKMLLVQPLACLFNNATVPGYITISGTGCCVLHAHVHTFSAGLCWSMIRRKPPLMFNANVITTAPFPPIQYHLEMFFREKLMSPHPYFSTSAFPPICFIVQIFSLLIYSFKFDLCKHEYLKSFCLIINSVCHNHICIKVLILIPFSRS